MVVVVPPHLAGARLDAALAQLLPDQSRSRLKRWIQQSAVLVDGAARDPSDPVHAGQEITVRRPPREADGPQPEKMELEILYEDAWLIAINKPPGMVVHPAKGHWRGTLTGGLLHQFAQLSGLGGQQRPGIVHRLDRDTSGVILVAKDDATHAELNRQFEQREVEKKYWALVNPPPARDRDVIDAPIGPHPYQREKMSIRSGHRASRPAQTFYELKCTWASIALLHVWPKTGRTHQIRVHLAHLGCPILADRLYSGRHAWTRTMLDRAAGHHRPPPRQKADPLEEIVLRRQALHAMALRLTHPITHTPLEISAPLPPDLQHVIELLSANGTVK
jgi:23S rRNA pseudouridine1911/1915/1917 synthase